MNRRAERQRGGEEVPWRVDEALRVLQASMDPYIWEQGQDLSQRGAVKDFGVSQDGQVQVIVLDPRDARNFFVIVRREYDGRVVSKCPCPYRLNGYCRHQVVALEYLKSVVAGETTTESAAEEPTQEAKREGATVREHHETRDGVEQEPVIFRLFGGASSVPMCSDGSLLRMVLLSLGSLEQPHRVGLQLFTGKGWSEVRTPDLERWIGRGDLGPHPRDAALSATIVVDGTIRGELNSESFSYLLSALAGSDALVDRSGRVLPVRLAPWSLRAELVHAEPDGISVRLSCVTDTGESCPLDDVAIVPSVGAWVQSENGVFHPLGVAVPGRLLCELQEADLTRIHEDELDRFLVEGVPQLERLSGEFFFVEPGLIQEVEGVDGARLRLSAGSQNRLTGKVEFSYGGEWVAAPETPAPWTVKRDGQIHRYPAAGQSLARAKKELEASGFAFEDGVWVIEGEDALERTLASSATFVDVELPEDLQQFDLVRRAPQLKIFVSSGEDEEGDADACGSFLVNFRLFDGDRPVPVPLEGLTQRFEGKKFAARGRRSVLRLDDGTVLGLDHPAVRELAEVLFNTQNAGDTEESGEGATVRVAATSIGTFLDTPDDVDVELAPEIESLVLRVRGKEQMEGSSALIDRIRDTLRAYQHTAVDWFGDLARWRLAGILADEMGLGKTVMTLAHFFGREVTTPRGSEEGLPLLVVCPTSLMFNWADECRRFFPEVKAVSLQGLPQKDREKRLAEPVDVVVTSYALMRRDREALESREFRGVVLDEAQHIKNADSQTAKAAFALRARERWGLTGTPIENHLGELWSIFRFLLPGFLGQRDEFRARYKEPAERGDVDAIDELRRRVSPFILRRTKDQVLSDLPPCIEQVERVPMTDEQRALYEAQLLTARVAAEGSDQRQARFKVLAALTRLRQICCHPRLVADKKGGGKEVLEAMGFHPESSEGSPKNTPARLPTSGKFELLHELLEECCEEGHRVLLFSQFTSMLDLIEERLDADSVPRCRLDGSTRDREGEVRRFERDTEIPIFLISLKAGGHGLNLTGADTVILYDPWWNPAAEEQAVARSHRMGQSLPVHVHKLITVDTVEEKIQELQASKRNLAGKLLAADDDPLGSLDLDAIRSLLE